MTRIFVTEAVMLAIYGQLLVPPKPVEYIIPYTTILELYELHTTEEHLMNSSADDQHVKIKIGELISYFEEPLNKKKIERALQVPWSKSPTIPVSESTRVTVMNTMDTAPYGESFDPVETELLLASQRAEAPILTDQYELIQRIVESALPVQVYDIDDFDFALEVPLSGQP
ncbi:ADP-heptose synthase [Virgibacillus sp. LDC1]|uniref:ADP-heptose synthase n=1 Tax=Paenibacillus lautus TaxID=1401 RepID=UPI002DBF6E30|nr:ADP-heptose synthase [Paenibacillus lautus]MCV4232049.1 ADP-heptose synthase [Virgibacillus sp. LDC1]MEC0256054.1 ADP-heptose synthase [Paenibacillus lautus]